MIEETFLIPEESVVPVSIGERYKDYKLSQLLPKSINVVVKGFPYIRDEEGAHITLYITIKKPDAIEYVCGFFPVTFLPCDSLIIEPPFCFEDALIRIYDNQSSRLVGLYYKNTCLPIADSNPITLPKPLLLVLNLREPSDMKTCWGIRK